MWLLQRVSLSFTPRIAWPRATPTQPSLATLCQREKLDQFSLPQRGIQRPRPVDLPGLCTNTAVSSLIALPSSHLRILFLSRHSEPPLFISVCFPLSHAQAPLDCCRLFLTGEAYVGRLMVGHSRVSTTTKSSPDQKKHLEKYFGILGFFNVGRKAVWSICLFQFPFPTSQTPVSPAYTECCASVPLDVLLSLSLSSSPPRRVPFGERGVKLALVMHGKPPVQGKNKNCLVRVTTRRKTRGNGQRRWETRARDAGLG